MTLLESCWFTYMFLCNNSGDGCKIISMVVQMERFYRLSAQKGRKWLMGTSRGGYSVESDESLLDSINV